MKLSEFSGLLLVNKPSGMTSHDVVQKVRNILGIREVGHSGTLDPIAEGLMILLIGQGTKLSQYILQGNKKYRAQILLGTQTDTFDITGKILGEKNVDQTFEQIKTHALTMTGEFEWPVPIFSAVKIDGKKLYEYARETDESKKVSITCPTKLMKFWDLDIQDLGPSEIQVSMSCSKGSYVRTWISELGSALGCGATMKGLTRTGSEPYELSQAISLEDLAKFSADFESANKSEDQQPMELLPAFVSLREAMPWMMLMRVSGQDEQLLKNGQISQKLKSALIREYRPGKGDWVQVHTFDNQLLAILGLQEQGFQIRRVFH